MGCGTSVAAPLDRRSSDALMERSQRSWANSPSVITEGLVELAPPRRPSANSMHTLAGIGTIDAGSSMNGSGINPLTESSNHTGFSSSSFNGGGGSSIDGGGGDGDGGGDVGGDVTGTSVRWRWLVGEGVARNTGNHCGGGTAAAGWLVCASLLATLGLVMCGRKALRKAAATPMRTSTRKPEASFFAYRRRRGDVEGSTAGQRCSQRGLRCSQKWRCERYVRNMGCSWLLQIESLCMLGYAARACMSRRGLSRACFSLMIID